MRHEDALRLLSKYNKDSFHIRHGLTVENVMGVLAEELGYGAEREFWENVGLLHDLDFELYPDAHCVKGQELMQKEGLSPDLIRAAASHGYGLACDIKPEKEMEKVLFAVDELTGLIGAAALMRPSRSVQDLELKSVKKKYKSPSFAAGCSREVIQQGADMLGWPLDDLITRTILAMRQGEERISREMKELGLES